MGTRGKRIEHHVLTRLRKLIAEGRSRSEAARITRVGRTTVWRKMKEALNVEQPPG